MCYTDEDYAIAGAPLEELCTKRDVGSVLAADQTSFNLPPGMASAAQTCQEAQVFFNQVPEELKNNFGARNRDRVQVEKDRIKATPIRIMPVKEEEVTALLKTSGGWSAFGKKYPGTRDIFSSRGRESVAVTITRFFMWAPMALSVAEVRTCSWADKRGVENPKNGNSLGSLSIPGTMPRRDSRVAVGKPPGRREVLPVGCIARDPNTSPDD